MRKEYRIMLFDQGDYMWVTKIDRGTRNVVWESPGEAITVSEKIADDVVAGLIANGIPAFAVKADKNLVCKNTDAISRNRCDELLRGVISFTICDTAELDYAETDLREMGFNDSEMIKYGFPVRD